MEVLRIALLVLLLTMPFYGMAQKRAHGPKAKNTPAWQKEKSTSVALTTRQPIKVKSLHHKNRSIVKTQDILPIYLNRYKGQKGPWYDVVLIGKPKKLIRSRKKRIRFRSSFQ
ncbi:MAG: hypothetical protein KTR24_11785 [Saprospiraceae bacterium]|nr:hypothetical protein [Saprospiraceae bacterium]